MCCVSGCKSFEQLIVELIIRLARNKDLPESHSQDPPSCLGGIDDLLGLLCPPNGKLIYLCYLN